MIPHALAHGILQNGADTLEFSFLTLSPEGFTTRFTKEDAKRFLTGAAAEFVFFTGWSQENARNSAGMEKSDYETVRTTTYSLQKLSKGEVADVYEISVLEKAFSQKVRDFSKAYLTYIQRKQNRDEDEIAHAMTNPARPYPVGEDFSFFQTRREQELFLMNGEPRNNHQKNNDGWAELFTFFSPGIALETPWATEDYCKQPYSGWEEYFRSKGMENPPAIASTIRGIALGNAFCPELLPSKELFYTFLQILPKSVEWLIFALPPVSAEREEQLNVYFCEILNLFCKARKQGVSLWWECADLGTETFLRKTVSGMPDVYVTKGVLRHKTLRDPRRRYLTGENGEEWHNLMFSDSALYLPYFQTNLGTFCPLAAAVKTGERGMQERKKDCPHYCREAGFLYPKHLRTVGRYNGLFGFYLPTAQNCEMLKKVVKEPICKVVMNL